jgi:hypothetical protein
MDLLGGVAGDAECEAGSFAEEREEHELRLRRFSIVECGAVDSSPVETVSTSDAAATLSSKGGTAAESITRVVIRRWGRLKYGL